MRTERRREPRHPFVARAEIIDEKENARTSSRVSDLTEVRHQHCDFDIVFSFFFWKCFVFNCDRLKTRCSADQPT
jgi:hypothetical protein